MLITPIVSCSSFVMIFVPKSDFLLKLGQLWMLDVQASTMQWVTMASSTEVRGSFGFIYHAAKETIFAFAGWDYQVFD